MNEVEIIACCYSKKEDVSIGCGIYIDAEKEHVVQFDDEWIWEGMAEAFWENYEEFESGIEKAKQLLKSNPNLTNKQALYTVFGNFTISFKRNDEELCLSFEPNHLVYDMLEKCLL